MFMFMPTRMRLARARPSCSLHPRSHAQWRAFRSLGVSQALVNQLHAVNVTTPTAAQARAIPSILQRRDVVVAAETGGGKTLAYVVPLLEQLRTHAHAGAWQDVPRPVALILTTSQELVAQVAAVVRAVDPALARHTVALSSANQWLGRRACPLLIATPAALLRATKPRDFAFTEHIVVDEADMLLSGGFERDTKQIIATIRNQPLRCAALNHEATQEDRDGDDEETNVSTERRQTVFSAATIPDYGKRSIEQYIQYKFPDAVFAVTEGFHRTLPQLEVVVHDLDERMAEHVATDTTSDEEERRCHRLELLEQVLTVDKQRPALVFANSIASAEDAHAYLSKQGSVGECLLYHKEVSREQRAATLALLREPDARVVVVCTDIAARGLDTTTVRHVVQYEFANDVVSYIHRMGRTARAGGTGKVSSIVDKQNELVLAKIQEAGSESLRGAFSRKRSLRKKVKKLRNSLLQ